MASLREELREAIKDFRYLLSRGYRRESILPLVGDKYGLSKDERLILYRGIHDPETAARNASKLVPLSAVRGKRVAVDGYNVLITVESLLLGKVLFICDDRFLRDVSAVHGKHKFSEVTKEALTLILNLLKEGEPAEVGFFYDAQVSKSGELAALTRQMMSERGLRGTAVAVKMADLAALRFGEVIATSDSAVIDRAEAVIDLAAVLAERVGPSQPVDLKIV